MNIDTIKYNFKDILAVAAMTGSSVYENELTRLANLKVYRDEHISIQSIFVHYWEAFKAKYEPKLRPAIIENVEKMIKCRNLKYGYLFFECPTCNNYHLQGLSCHSRFCPSCNEKYREARTLAIQSKLLEANHRHFVFSIAEELRQYFFHYRGLFDVLFNTVNQALHKTVRQSKLKQKLNLKLGVICFLHTYGRDMKANPHIHALIAEKTLDDLSRLNNFYYFPFDRLRMYYQYLLLQNMSKYLKRHASKDVYNAFNRLRTFLNNKYKKGFYTYGPQVSKSFSLSSAKGVSDYIARYASHPAISESRIQALDLENHTVTWFYDPHEDDDIVDEASKQGCQVVTEHIFTFIKKLIRHIPDKGCHLIRYYGFYANKSTSKISSFKKLRQKSSIRYDLAKTKFRSMIKSTYHYDPLLCPCGSVMKLNLDSSFLPSRKRGLISDA